jgi:hypothetical protein
MAAQGCCERVLFRRGSGANRGGMPEPRAASRGIRGQSHLVRALAADQEGVVSRSQLLAGGVSGWAIDRAVGSGALHRLYAGVYAVVAPELLTEDGSLIAALLAAGAAPCWRTARRRGGGG